VNNSKGSLSAAVLKFMLRFSVFLGNDREMI
jgi:hypothetical protein